MNRSYSSEGIIIKRKNYGEADRIITLISKNYGKIILLAKGIRKLSSKKRGHLEIFSRIKFSAVSGNGMDIMTEASTLDNFDSMRSDLNKVSLGYYFCEVVGKITRDNEEMQTVYSQLSTALKNIETATNLKNHRKKFIFDLLVEMGYWPMDKKMIDPDIALDEVLERKLTSLRVGKKVIG